MTVPTAPAEDSPGITDTLRQGKSRMPSTIDKPFGRERVSGAVALVMLGTLLFALGTRWGIGIRPDSVVYLGLADTGTTQAPLYSLLIGVARSWGLPPMRAAWWLNLLLMLANVLLVWHLLKLATSSATSALLGALAVLVLPAFLYMHETALSDGLFLMLILLFMLAITYYVEGGRRTALYASGLAGALAMLTRFAGFPLLAVGFVAILLFRRASWRTRLLDGLFFLAFSLGLFVAWLVGDMLQGGKGTGREIAFLGNPTAETFVQGFNSLSAFLAPTMVAGPVRAFLLAFVAIALVVVTVSYARRNRRQGETPPLATLPYVAVLFILCYVSFLVFSVFVEANLPFQARYLVPIFVASVLVITVGMKGRAAPKSLARYARAAGVLAMALIAANAARAAKQTWTLFHEGNFYAGPSWYTSPILQYVKTLDPRLAIYTNAPDAVTFLTGRASFWVPKKFDRRTGMDDPGQPFETQMAELGARLREGSAVVVHLDQVDFRFYLPGERELVGALDLEPLFRAEDGTVYRYRTSLSRPHGSGPS
jgi:hypothetical protein